MSNNTATSSELQAGRDAAVKLWTECGIECETLRRQRDALVAALTKYGWHESECESLRKPTVSDPNLPCTCGFRAALKQVSP